MAGQDNVRFRAGKLRRDEVVIGGEDEAVDDVDAAVDHTKGRPPSSKVGVLGKPAIHARPAREMR